ncbi:MAG TPA: hypothetical protein VLD60_14055, partial [Nitrospira sp.]|nr:hypothetical protein [Nitrospira sp.]
MSTLAPNRDEILAALAPFCSDVPPDILQDFVGRMDQEYFRRFHPETIARHVHLAALLTPDQPCKLAI